MTDARVQAALRRVFDVIMREVAHNPGLAQRLAEALAADIPAGLKSQPAARRAFDASQLHAVNILRVHGEAALRGRLEQIKAVEDLKAVAKASGLLLSGGAGRARPSRIDLIEGIIAAAKHYDAQRTAATA